MPAKDKRAVVRFALRKPHRPDGPAGNVPLCNYKLGNIKGTYFFPAIRIYSKKHPTDDVLVLLQCTALNHTLVLGVHKSIIVLFCVYNIFGTTL